MKPLPLKIRDLKGNAKIMNEQTGEYADVVIEFPLVELYEDSPNYYSRNYYMTVLHDKTKEHFLQIVVAEKVNEQTNEKENVNMIYFVDTERGTNGFTRTLIHKIDLSIGKHSFVLANEGSAENHAYELIRIVRSEKPRQIVFDKQAFGLSLYDSFVKEVEKSNSVKMESNGTLYYAP